MFHAEELSTTGVAKEDEIHAEWNVKFRRVDKSLNGNFKEHFPNCEEHGFVTSEPGGFFLMDKYSHHAEKIYRFQPRSDDVWVVTFPRCGKIPFLLQRLVLSETSNISSKSRLPDS